MIDAAERVRAAFQRAAQQLDLAEAARPRGVVRRVGDGVAHVTGLEHVGYEELLWFDSGGLGMAYDLAEDSTGVILLADAEHVREGDGVRGAGRLPELPVGPAVLGRIIDPLGNPLDEGPRLPPQPRLPLFRSAPEIVDRQAIAETLWTGVMAIDAAIPIGRGQRELIIGDRNVGKTALAVDILAAQRSGDVACVYVVIGQAMSRVISLRQILQSAGCLANTAIVAADASSSPGMQYLAPYAGASLAEAFRDNGEHALVVYDDLTKHADAYREIALLLGRPPGREAFPGDIFYVHAELLERASARRLDRGGGSVTALPLIETTDGEISSYIPTNLISITDGQIFLDTARFERNLRPAIDVGRSVSRVGARAQGPGMRKWAKNLRILLSRFESLESLSRVGLDMEAGMQQTIRQGRQLRELLRQDRLQHRDIVDQALALAAVAEDWLEGVPLKKVRPLIQALSQRVRSDLPAVVEAIRGTSETGPEWLKDVTPLARQIRSQFVEAGA